SADHPPPRSADRGPPRAPNGARPAQEAPRVVCERPALRGADPRGALRRAERGRGPRRLLAALVTRRAPIASRDAAWRPRRHPHGGSRRSYSAWPVSWWTSGRYDRYGVVTVSVYS